jgi:hypothetical protein
LSGEARLRLRGLLPIVALAVPYGAAAAVAAAVLTPPPSGPLPTSGAAVAATRPGDRPLQRTGAFGGNRGTGGPLGAGREARSEGTGNAGVGGQPGAGGSGQQAAGAGGEPRPAGAGQSTADAGASAAGRNSASGNGAEGNRSAAGAGDQQASGTSRGVTGGPGEQGAGGTRGAAAAGTGVLPAADSRAAAQGAGSGRGPRSTAKPFVEGRQAYGRNDGGDIVVTGIETAGDAGTSAPSVPDSAVSRGIRLTPAPLIDWSSPSVSHQGGADIPRVYRPRQALPAWTAPLVPGAAPGRP